MEYKDYYKILGVDRKATPDQIKQAYRRLARKYHPDVSKETNAEEKFKDLQEAYEVLKDNEKKAAYDQLGSNWKSGQEFRQPPGWDDSSFHFRSAGGERFTESDLGGFSDFFRNLFGGGGAGRRGQSFDFEDNVSHQFHRPEGRDQHAKINISLEDAFRGTTKTLQLQVPEMDANGRVQYTTRTLKVNIPAGAQNGQQLRLAKQGSKAPGGSPGDLYLEIHIEAHPFFSLQGHDVYLTLPVSPWEAALGAEIKVPTLGGPVGLKLAPGSQTGQKLRLKSRGMPGKPHAGDQYAIVEILVPPAHSDEQKQVYKMMAEKMPFNPRKHWPS